jgi:hypothetical protein
VVALLGAFVTVIYGISSLKQAAKNEFAAKAASFIFASSTPHETMGKANFVRGVFGNDLPSGFTMQLSDPSKYGDNPDQANPEQARNLIKLLAEYPDQRKQILVDWLKLLPDNQWVAKLQNK